MRTKTRYAIESGEVRQALEHIPLDEHTVEDIMNILLAAVDKA